MPAMSFLNGQRFGRLTVLTHVGTYVRCACDCGAEKLLRTDRVKSGKTQSCGCLRSDLRASQRKPAPAIPARPTRTAAQQRMAAVYFAMVNRCTNPNDKNYASYGGRGISVCPRWLGNPDVFIKDMEPQYRPGLWLERKDNDLGYSPGNCTFATPHKQSRNRRNTVIFPNGSLFPNWCRLHHLDYAQAYRAYRKVEAALGRPPLQAEVLASLGG